MSDNVDPWLPLPVAHHPSDESPTSAAPSRDVRLIAKALSRHIDPTTKNRRKPASTPTKTGERFSDTRCDCVDGAPKTFPSQVDSKRHMWASHYIYDLKTKMYVCVACREEGRSTIFMRKDNFKTHCMGSENSKLKKPIPGQHPERDWRDLVSRSEVLACKNEALVEHLKTKSKRQKKGESRGSVSRPSITDSAHSTFSAQPSSSMLSSASSQVNLYACLWPRCANGDPIFDLGSLIQHLTDQHGLTYKNKIVCPYNICEHRFMLAEIEKSPMGYYYHVKFQHSDELVHEQPLDPRYEMDPFDELQFGSMFQW